MVLRGQGRPEANVAEAIRQHGGRTPFGERQLLPEFEALPEIGGDSTDAISEDRDRE